MRPLIALSSDRFGPDLVLTHWMLYFNFTNKWLTHRTLKKLGKNSEIRPYVTIIGGKNIEIGDNVVLRPGTYIDADIGKLIIEDNVLFGPNIYITTTNHNYEDITKPVQDQGNSENIIRIKEGSWIGTGAIIFNGVTIGKNAVVGAGAVVKEDVPDYCVVGGVPAKVIKQLR